MIAVGRYVKRLSVRLRSQWSGGGAVDRGRAVNWWWLLAARDVEIAWAMSIKPTEGFTRPVSAGRIGR